MGYVIIGGIALCLGILTAQLVLHLRKVRQEKLRK